LPRRLEGSEKAASAERLDDHDVGESSSNASGAEEMSWDDGCSIERWRKRRGAVGGTLEMR